ncbi:hypothetical protein QBC39DRAFT_60879 [Podospora conica]|nr:hypothetical protein QBC39DRAFT_60879 [Schizothecium conicum]
MVTTTGKMAVGESERDNAGQPAGSQRETGEPSIVDRLRRQKFACCCCSGAAANAGYSACCRNATGPSSTSDIQYNRVPSLCAEVHWLAGSLGGLAEFSTSRLQARPELAEAGESEPKRHATSVVAVTPSVAAGMEPHVVHTCTGPRPEAAPPCTLPLPSASPLSQGQRRTASYAAANRASSPACFCVESSRGAASTSAIDVANAAAQEGMPSAIRVR